MKPFPQNKKPLSNKGLKVWSQGGSNPDLYAASVALSQLSYGPVCNVMFIIDDFILKNKLFPLELTEK